MKRFRIETLAAIAVPLVVSCESLDEEIPTAAFVSWPELEWYAVPAEHAQYLPAMTIALDSVVDFAERHFRVEGHYPSDLRPIGPDFPSEGVTVILSSGAEYAEITATHAEAPGSGCIVRLGARRLTAFDDVEGLVEVPYSFGMRLPDEPGTVECMQRKAEEELRPRITRHEL